MNIVFAKLRKLLNDVELWLEIYLQEDLSPKERQVGAAAGAVYSPLLAGREEMALGISC